MTAGRLVLAEALDGLAADDADAMRSRRDLQRVHRVMGTRTIVRRALCEMLAARRSRAPLRILELGAGDGSLMLGVAGSLPARWPPVALTLLDRQPLVPPSTRDAFAALRWSATPWVADVMDWAASNTDALPPWDLIVANLFLHHFEGQRLAKLLAAVAGRAQRLLACEPRRSALALAGSHLVGALGVNAVTRADAVLSVRAGFRGRELTALWPADPGQWRLREYGAGLFSHCFSAVRVGADG
jgi:hypothetical protein